MFVSKFVNSITNQFNGLAIVKAYVNVSPTIPAFEVSLDATAIKAQDNRIVYPKNSNLVLNHLPDINEG